LEAGWARESAWTRWGNENLWPYHSSSSDSSVVRSIASCYTECATATRKYENVGKAIKKTSGQKYLKWINLTFLDITNIETLARLKLSRMEWRVMFSIFYLRDPLKSRES
jgi:hypothetical protein